MKKKKHGWSKAVFALLIVALLSLTAIALMQKDALWMLLSGAACVFVALIASVFSIRQRYLDTIGKQRKEIAELKDGLLQAQKDASGAEEAFNAEIARLKSENTGLRAQSYETKELMQELQDLKKRQSELDAQLKQTVAPSSNKTAPQPIQPPTKQNTVVHPANAPSYAGLSSSKGVATNKVLPTHGTVQPTAAISPHTAADPIIPLASLTAKPLAPPIVKTPVNTPIKPSMSKHDAQSKMLRVLRGIDETGGATLLPLTDDFDITDVYHKDGFYYIEEAICDYFSEFKERFGPNSDIVGHVMRHFIEEDFENGYMVWRWVVMHFQEVLKEPNESYTIGEGVLEYFDGDIHKKLMNRLEQDEQFRHILFSRSAYADEGFANFCARCAAAMRHTLFDTLLTELIIRREYVAPQTPKEKLLHELIDAYYIEWSAETRASIEKHINAITEEKKRNELKRFLEKKWNDCLEYAEMKDRRRMLGLVPPKVDDPFTLDERIDLAQAYIERDYCNIKTAMCDYFSDIRESYGDEENCTADEVLKDLLELDFDHGMKIWRWALCHFRSVVAKPMGAPITDNAIFSIPRAVYPRLANELAKDTALAEALFKKDYCYRGSYNMLLYCIREKRFELFKRLYSFCFAADIQEKDGFAKENILEDAINALRRNMLTEEWYDYFFAEVSALPAKLKRELLQKRLQTLRAAETVATTDGTTASGILESSPDKKRQQRTRNPMRADSAPDPALAKNYYASYTVSGTGFISREILKQVSIDERVMLRREPENEHDTNAILVENGAGEKLGYIPRANNAELAAMMDTSKQYYAVVFDTDTTLAYPLMAIDVFSEA